MHVGIKEGGDGVRCWNRQSVLAYADQVNSREVHLAQRNPDVVVLPGRLVCYGCEVMDYDYGIKCTAQLTRTRFAVQGETEPRAEDAVGSLLEVPGLLGRAPAEVQPEPATPRRETGRDAGSPTVGAVAGPSVAPEGSRRGGLRGLFGR